MRSETNPFEVACALLIVYLFKPLCYILKFNFRLCRL
jgi:hypothetical protein